MAVRDVSQYAQCKAPASAETGPDHNTLKDVPYSFRRIKSGF